KCGGGFAKTGRAKPCPVPAHCAGTVDEGYVRAVRGVPRPSPPMPPSLEGGSARRRGGCLPQDATPVQTNRL
ncbi:MAG: hypothetical protein LBM98_06285, partial [Oscillospiraceae bacterium]|nr:hypothetical protein [Oscillospiraceae bacterium]